MAIGCFILLSSVVFKEEKFLRNSGYIVVKIMILGFTYGIPRGKFSDIREFFNISIKN